MKHIKKYENSYSERNLFDIAKDVFSFLIDENKITIEDQTEYTSKYGHERFEILFDHTYTEPRTLNEFRKSVQEQENGDIIINLTNINSKQKSQIENLESQKKQYEFELSSLKNDHKRLVSDTAILRNRLSSLEQRLYEKDCVISALWMENNEMKSNAVLIEGFDITIEDVIAVATCKRALELSDKESFRVRISRGAEFVDRLIAEDGVVYGVSTGYGDSCTVTIPPSMISELPAHLYTYHGCGLGRFFDEVETRAILVSRLVSLSKGVSGVSYGLLEQISGLLQNDILPRIPAEGSVGASGDLTPLSYVAAALCGDREVLVNAEIHSAAVALRAAGMAPIQLRPKEGLAIMNGTAVMTALACLAWKRADYLARLSTRITAFAVIGSAGNAHHFDETLFSVKPHAGQQRIARRLRVDLASDRPPRNEKRLQDRYSLRCAPHVIGVLEDALPWFKQTIENELNSANDNPIIDAEQEMVLHGGHFYGGHIAFVMDSMKNTVANLADLMDRQMALLVDERYSHGLPANLTGA